MSRNSQLGANLVEYSLLVALVAISCIVALQLLGVEAERTFCLIAAGINGEINSTGVSC